jgi:hypothetical protein
VQKKLKEGIPWVDTFEVEALPASSLFTVKKQTRIQSNVPITHHTTTQKPL